MKIAVVKRITVKANTGNNAGASCGSCGGCGGGGGSCGSCGGCGKGRSYGGLSGGVITSVVKRQ